MLLRKNNSMLENFWISMPVSAKSPLPSRSLTTARFRAPWEPACLAKPPLAGMCHTLDLLSSPVAIRHMLLFEFKLIKVNIFYK